LLAARNSNSGCWSTTPCISGCLYRDAECLPGSGGPGRKPLRLLGAYFAVPGLSEPSDWPVRPGLLCHALSFLSGPPGIAVLGEDELAVLEQAVVAVHVAVLGKAEVAVLEPAVVAVLVAVLGKAEVAVPESIALVPPLVMGPLEPLGAELAAPVEIVLKPSGSAAGLACHEMVSPVLACIYLEVLRMLPSCNSITLICSFSSFTPILSIKNHIGSLILSFFRKRKAQYSHS